MEDTRVNQNGGWFCIQFLFIASHANIPHAYFAIICTSKICFVSRYTCTYTAHVIQTLISSVLKKKRAAWSNKSNKQGGFRYMYGEENVEVQADSEDDENIDVEEGFGHRISLQRCDRCGQVARVGHELLSLLLQFRLHSHRTTSRNASVLNVACALKGERRGVVISRDLDYEQSLLPLRDSRAKRTRERAPKSPARENVTRVSSEPAHYTYGSSPHVTFPRGRRSSHSLACLFRSTILERKETARSLHVDRSASTLSTHAGSMGHCDILLQGCHSSET